MKKQISLTKKQEKVLDYVARLQKSRLPITVSAIAKLIRKTTGTAYSHISALVTKGRLAKTKDGYRLK